MEANFSTEGADSTRYTAKSLTFLPERRILFTWLAMNNCKEVLHDTGRILGNPDPLSEHKSWGRLCVLFEKTLCVTASSALSPALPPE